MQLRILCFIKNLVLYPLIPFSVLSKQTSDSQLRCCATLGVKQSPYVYCGAQSLCREVNAFRSLPSTPCLPQRCLWLLLGTAPAASHPWQAAPVPAAPTLQLLSSALCCRKEGRCGARTILLSSAHPHYSRTPRASKRGHRERWLWTLVCETPEEQPQQWGLSLPPQVETGCGERKKQGIAG